MAEKGFGKRFLETKWFGLLIGLLVFGLLAALTYGTNIISSLETKVLDFNFRMKNPKQVTRLKEGVTVEQADPRISPDIVIVGIDERSLARFGRWPFPRYRHADLVNTFARIADQRERERALFLDIFFSEPDEKSPQDDAAAVEAIHENGRVFLESVLQREPFPESAGEGPFERQKILTEHFGTVSHIEGDWTKVDSFLGLKPPLTPYAQATHGHGHANYVQDEDQIYRRASLLARASQLVAEIPLEQLSVDTPVNHQAFERLSWVDRHNVEHTLPYPLDQKRISELREEMKRSGTPSDTEEIPLADLTLERAGGFGVSDHVYWMDHRGRARGIAVPITEASLLRLRDEAVRDAAAIVRAADVADAGGRLRWTLGRLANFFGSLFGRAEKSVAGDRPTAAELAAGLLVYRDAFVVKKYRETWLPSVTLALAAEYMNVKLSDVEVVLGKHVRIPNPRHYNVEAASWEPYSVLARPAKIDAKTGDVVEPEQRNVISEVLIPVDERGQMLINFMGYPSSATFGAPSTYPVRSFYRYASSPPGSDPATWSETAGMANKIVMLGAFSQGMAEDQKPTPFGLMFGVEIHANTLNTILTGNFLTYAPFWLSLLILFGIVMLTAFATGRLSTVWSLVMLVVLLVVYFGAVLVVFDFSAYILTLTAPLFGSFLCFLAVVAYRTVFEERDKRRNKAIFSKIVGPTVLKELLDHPPELGGVDKTLTVFFSDIRGFSSISERLKSQDLLKYLNKYLTSMADVVKDYNGTLDKYIGDAVMCFWGAPVEQPDHALLACKCALKSMEVLGQLNEGWAPEERIDIGIGISTGTMTAGYMGSKDRLNYTVIGDAVNLGSRLEGLNKMYYSAALAAHYSRILISDNTFEEVKDQVVARELDIVRVKGKEKPGIIYELIDVVGGYEPPKPDAAKGRILAAEAAADRRERAAQAKAAARAAARR